MYGTAKLFIVAQVRVIFHNNVWQQWLQLSKWGKNWDFSNTSHHITFTCSCDECFNNTKINIEFINRDLAVTAKVKKLGDVGVLFFSETSGYQFSLSTVSIIMWVK